jgi:hypothetical protein
MFDEQEREAMTSPCFLVKGLQQTAVHKIWICINAHNIRWNSIDQRSG